jgi:DNA-directed RNA polymerase
MNDTLLGIELTLEEGAVTDGIEKYRNALVKAQKKDRTHFPPELELMLIAIPPVAKRITADLLMATKGRTVGELRKALTLETTGKFVNPDVLALLTLRHAINNYGSFHTVQRIAIGLADTIRMYKDDQRLATHEEKRLRGYRAKVLKNTVQKSNDERYKHRVMGHTRRKLGLTDSAWDDRFKLILGQRLLDCLLAECGDYFELKRIPRNNKSWRGTGSYERDWIQTLVSTDLLDEHLEMMHSNAEALLPVFKPMVVPPKPWTSMVSGGYLKESLMRYSQCRLVRGVSNKRLKDMKATAVDERILNALNAIQDTPYRINQRVLDVMTEMAVVGGQAGIPEKHIPDPPVKPWEMAENLIKGHDYNWFKANAQSEIDAYNRAASKLWSAHYEAKGQRTSFREKHKLAKKFREFERFWFPMNMDWRGRVLTLSSPMLSPQGDDASKGLLEFADGKEISAEGFLEFQVHGANVFGEDKLSVDGRIQWVDDHHDKLLLVDADPFREDIFEWWTNADKPFQFLAFCFDYAAYMKDRSHKSRLICHIDQTCSGLQHWSAVLADEQGAKSVGMVNKPMPDDIYLKVADAVEELIKDDNDPLAKVWQGKVTRIITKRNVMTKLYGATMPGMRDQVEKELKALDKKSPTGAYLELPEGYDNYKAADYISRKNNAAMQVVVKKATEGMEFMQKLAKALAESECGVSWTSPIGLEIEQYYPEKQKIRVNTYWAGLKVDTALYKHAVENRKKRRVDLTLTYPSPEDGVRVSKATNSIAPNFIHSMDASHLMFIALAFDGCLSTVHDSFGTHASDVPALLTSVRQAFIDMYQGHDHLDEVLAENIRRSPHVDHDVFLPERGQFDFNNIKDATYFCR